MSCLFSPSSTQLPSPIRVRARVIVMAPSLYSPGCHSKVSPSFAMATVALSCPGFTGIFFPNAAGAITNSNMERNSFIYFVLSRNCCQLLLMQFFFPEMNFSAAAAEAKPAVWLPIGLLSSGSVTNEAFWVSANSLGRSNNTV